MHMEEQDLLLDEQPPAGLSPAELAYWHRLRERIVRGMLAYRAANYVSDSEWELRLAMARSALSVPMPLGNPADPEQAEKDALRHRFEDVPDLSEDEYNRHVIAGVRQGAISAATERLYSQAEVEALVSTWSTE
ncbi:hypothetical protein [Longimicrobium sp.]|jgi:hypothetical protein|uniref:hypothetical protein n=1 Tax=Longimicrobium sp. TaxID=2029185 RepID=UPI002F958639